MIDLIEESIGDLVLWEGCYGHMYLDTKGLVTTAIGHLLAAPADAVALPFAIDGRPATDVEKRAGWQRVKAMPPARNESYYASASKARLTPSQCHDLARSRLATEFLPALRARLPGFDGFPHGVQRAIIDVVWNYGTAGLFKTHTFFPQLLAGDWKKAAETCLLLSSRPLRNEWRAARFREAA